MKQIVLLALLSLVFGCDSGRNLGSVAGTVTYKGKPLKSGSITFIPKDGRQSTGKIVDGRIVDVTTFDKGDGASLGQCKVLVHAYKNPDDMENLQLITPRKYGSEESSPLTATIESGQNKLSFNLK